MASPKTKYKTLEELAAAARSGEFKGRVIVDNDCVDAYTNEEDGGEHVYAGDGPEYELVELLTNMGLNADRA